MKLGDCNKRASSLKNLHKEWIAQNIFPMASNIQIVFYRHHTTGHILVKALLNEEEVSLPANASQHPYYEWDELKNYYIQKLQEFSTNSIKKNHWISSKSSQRNTIKQVFFWDFSTKAQKNFKKTQ